MIGHRAIRPSSPEYPHFLKEIFDPPLKLYLAGRRLEPLPAIAIVGTRRASRYGLEAAAWLAEELASAGLTVVSGLASGVDAAAHRGALKAGGTTVGVLGCGLDVCYPPRNRGLYEAMLEKGTLLSEYEMGTIPMPYNFPVRNRIIAGMSLATVIVEARPRGGAMITARLAMEYGREVFAVPGPIHSDASFGCHSLVRQGARLATSATDILDDLGMLRLESPGSPGPPLDADERRVLGLLQADPALLDTIARESKMPASTLSAILARLEVKGLVSRHPGGRFALAVSRAGQT